MEKELGVLYLIVWGKFIDIIIFFGYVEKKKNEVDEKKVVFMLENGEIIVEEVIKFLKEE